jgi:hypothetical protein
MTESALTSNNIEHNHSIEANSLSDSQMFLILWKPKVHCRAKMSFIFVFLSSKLYQPFLYKNYRHLHKKVTRREEISSYY